MHKEWCSIEEASSTRVESSTSTQRRLRLINQQTEEKVPREIILDGVFHELRNCLQSIGIGADLLQLGRPETVESLTVTLGIERANRLLREAQEYCLPPEPYFSVRTLREALTETICAIEKEGEKSCIQLCDLKMLPPFRYDWLVLGRIFERVFRCARGVLPLKGGKVLVNVRVHQKRTQTKVEIQTNIHGKGELEVDEDKIFTPFWRVGNYQVGLGLMLARQAVASHNGQLTFKKMSSHHARFSILLNVLPETIASMEVGQEEDHVYVE